MLYFISEAKAKQLATRVYDVRDFEDAGDNRGNIYIHRVVRDALAEMSSRLALSGEN